MFMLVCGETQACVPYVCSHQLGNYVTMYILRTYNTIQYNTIQYICTYVCMCVHYLLRNCFTAQGGKQRMKVEIRIKIKIKIKVE